MRIYQLALMDFLGETGARFSIPRFQRAYTWEAEQCDELWRDLLRAARARRSHFLGTLIYVDSTQGQDGCVDYVIVDGQQRLTTLSLIVLALAKHMQASGRSFYGLDGQALIDTYLCAGHECKLQLARNDGATLTSMVYGVEQPANPSPRLLENYQRFCDKMKENEFDAAELWKSLNSLTAIAAQLDDSNQAPDVFESFNSKGTPLVTADLVRNYLLLAESHQEQARLFELYWEPLQSVFGDDPGSIRLNNAILGWLAVRFKKVRKFGDKHAFSIFKSYCEDEYTGSLEDLLDELYAFCMVWAENYRYHAVKKYKTADWARLGHKTRVSDRPRAKLDHPESADYYKRHFGVDPQW